MKIFWILLLLVTSCGKRPIFLSFGEKTKEKNIQELNSSERNFKETNYSYSLQWLSGPYNAGFGASEFKLRIWDKEKATLYGPFTRPEEKVCAFIWMTMPDGSEHGSSPLEVTKLDTEDGIIFHYKEAYFVMNGTWKLYLTLIEKKDNCLLNPSQKGISQVYHEIDIH